jgi:hypothetical protein
MYLNYFFPKKESTVAAIIAVSWNKQKHAKLQLKYDKVYRPKENVKSWNFVVCCFQPLLSFWTEGMSVVDTVGTKNMCLFFVSTCPVLTKSICTQLFKYSVF